MPFVVLFILPPVWQNIRLDQFIIYDWQTNELNIKDEMNTYVFDRNRLLWCKKIENSVAYSSTKSYTAKYTSFKVVHFYANISSVYIKMKKPTLNMY